MLLMPSAGVGRPNLLARLVLAKLRLLPVLVLLVPTAIVVGLRVNTSSGSSHWLKFFATLLLAQLLLWIVPHLW